MSFQPREQQTIYESLRDKIKGTIPGLSNFTETSFNWVWTQGFAREFREQELDKTAAYLSGMVEYAGGPVNEGDLSELGIEDVTTPEELNDRLADEHLDELVKIVGTKRDPGTRATGTVTFSTQTAPTNVPAGTSVGLQPDESGDFLEFETTEDVSNADDETTVSVGIRATDVGDEYNVGSGTITYLPSPPTGVQAVTNNEATTGGEDVETNDELRTRAQNAIFENSGGGTVEGIIGFIESEVDGVDEVEILEFYTGDTWHGNYPHAHVIVSGANDKRQEILDAINSSRPVAVEHILVRPDNYEIGIDTVLEGSDIEPSSVSGAINDYLDSLGLNDSVIDTQIVQAIMNADNDIEDIDTLNFYIQNESIYFDSSQNVYNLNFGDIMQNDGITEVTGMSGGNSTTFTEGDDYQEVDDSGDGSHDSIDWSLGGSDPDVNTGQTTTITYDSAEDRYHIDDALITGGITQVTGTSGGNSTAFTKGTDYEETDIRGDGQINAINWGIGGSSPDDGTDFTVTYDAGTAFDVTYLLQERTDIDFTETEQPITGTVTVSVV